MMVMQFAKQALLQYGPDGDRSFEYLGIVVDYQHVLEKRIYHIENPDAVKAIYKIEPYCSILARSFPSFAERKDVRMCDFSVDQTTTPPLYRIVFYVPKCTLKQEANSMREHFSRVFNKSKYWERMTNAINEYSNAGMLSDSVPAQIGVAGDGDGNLFSVKYYVRWSKELHEKEAYLSAMRRLLSDQQYHKIGQMTSVLFQHNFRPAFLGINDTEGCEEKKQYFISKSVSVSSDRLLRLQISLIQSLGYDKVLTEEEIRALFQMGLYVQGVALSETDTDVVRFYFNILKKRNR